MIFQSAVGNTNQSYTAATSRRMPTQVYSSGSSSGSDHLLQSSHGEGLHHRLRWLRLDHHKLAENLSLPSLGCWLQAGLDHHDSRDGELALLNLLGGHFHKALQDLLAIRLLHGALCLQGSQEFGLANRRYALHRLRLHRLHRLHRWRHLRQEVLEAMINGV